MSLHAVNILGINITNSPKKDILEDVQKYLKKRSYIPVKPYVIVTPNPEQIVVAHKNIHFQEMLNQADVAIPDGIGLVWARPVDIRQTIPGVDFMEELTTLATKEGVNIALIGGKEKVAVRALECLRQKYDRLGGIAIDAPQFAIRPSGLSMSGDMSEYFKKLSETLKKQKIGIVFVGLGAPKQELFIEKLVDSLGFIVHSKTAKTINHEPSTINPIVLMSVGGSFDEISGAIPRPPPWVTRIGIKWLWRLILEPWRFKRQLSLLKFIWLVVIERYKML